MYMYIPIYIQVAIRLDYKTTSALLTHNSSYELYLNVPIDEIGYLEDCNGWRQHVKNNVLS